MLSIKVKVNEDSWTFFIMMSAGKIVLLITVVLNISVPCFGAGLFLMPTTFWNSAPKSNQFQYSEPKETKGQLISE